MATVLRHLVVTTQPPDRDTLTLPAGTTLASVLQVRPVGPDLQWQVIVVAPEADSA